jgi:hypothetical protein
LLAASVVVSVPDSRSAAISSYLLQHPLRMMFGDS